MTDLLPPRHFERQAFSLVEVLVVAVVVGILTALVVPSIQQARLSALSASCVSNLRQLAIAHRQYEQEHDGKPPPQSYTASHPESDGHSGPGLRLLRRYYREGEHPVWNGGTFLQESTEMCPSVRINKLAANLQNGPHYDMCSLEDKNYALYYSKPSQRPLIWDGFTGSWTPGKPAVPLRHHGGINCAFLDGHVEFLRGDDGRLYHRWWYYACQLPEPDAKWLRSGNPMGATEVP